MNQGGDKTGAGGRRNIIGKARSVLFLYLVGTITAAQFIFLSETFFPLPVPRLAKSLIVTVFIPLIVIITGFVLGGRFRGSRRIDGTEPEDEQGVRKRLLRRLDWIIVAAVLFGTWVGGYFLTARLASGREMHSLMLEVDGIIPFKHTFVWFYLTIYPAFLVPFFYVDSRRLAKTVMYSYITVLLFCYVVFVIFPVSYPRAQLAQTDFSAWVLGLVYAGDPTWNCFPSSHCAFALMAGLVLLEASPYVGAWGVFVALTIGISTLLTKQHYILDVVAGYGLTLLIYYLYFKEKVIDIMNKKQREIYHRLETIFNSGFEDTIRRVVREELHKKSVEGCSEGSSKEKKEDGHGGGGGPVREKD